MKIKRNITNLKQYLIMDRQVLEGVQDFRYLDTLINSKNVISDEIKSRLAAGNRSFYSLRQISMSTAKSKAAKIKLYKMMVTTDVVYEVKKWL
jgi:hypothetical protein